MKRKIVEIKTSPEISMTLKHSRIYVDRVLPTQSLTQIVWAQNTVSLFKLSDSFSFLTCQERKMLISVRQKKHHTNNFKTIAQFILN